MISIDWPDVGEKINAEMLKRGLSSESVAAKAGIDRKTVDRLRHGKRVRIQTLSWVEQVLELSFIDARDQSGSGQAGIAPIELGGYSRDLYKDYVGSYFMFRNSYDFDDRIVCSYMQIYWDIDARCLKFRERQRNKSKDGSYFKYDFTGRLSIPPGMAIVQFVYSMRGLNRIITTTSLRGTEAPYFRGVLAGTNEISDVGFYPATTPVFILKNDQEPDDATLNRCVGSFPVGEIWLPEAVKELRQKTSRYSAFY